MLDAEHRKLATTIHETTHMVNTGQTPEDQSSDGKPGGSIGNDAGMLFVQGLDYKAILEQCPAGLGVAALDGRIVACNEEFANISGFSRDELLRQSVFNLMQNHDEVFRAMGQMLSSSDAIVQSASDDDNPPPPMYWSGIVNQRSQNVSVFCSVLT
jgi:PAS domain-containing protein